MFVSSFASFGRFPNVFLTLGVGNLGNGGESD